MNLRVITFFCLTFAIISSGFAQRAYNIHGVVRDTLTGESLIGVLITVGGEKQSGISTNAFGYFSGRLQSGSYALTFSYPGYRAEYRTLDLASDTLLNIMLSRENLIEEVIVRGDSKISDPQMGLERVSMNAIRNVPVLLGERDPFKTIQLLPGIKSAGEGNSGIFVRGGAADQNLILLDDAPVYNASHLLGFFSTFNADAIKSLNVYKGGMPAQYGGRLSSVVDVRMNDGNSKRFAGEGGIGLISSRIKLEGPIDDGAGSYMLSGRRTYADLFLGLSKDSTIQGNSLYFYDLNTKFNYQLNKKNTLYLSGYFGKDQLGLKETFGFEWGNATATVRWTYMHRSNLFVNTTLAYSRYNYEIENFLQESNFRLRSSISNLNLKHNYQLALADHNLNFGIDLTRHDLKPGIISSGSASNVNALDLEKRNAVETAFYASDEWQINPALSVNYGIRGSIFTLLGKGIFKRYSGAGQVLQEIYFGPGQKVVRYFNWEPRAAFSLLLNSSSSLKASYAKNTQNLHLMSNSTASFPTDLYILSSLNVKPERSEQISIGYFRSSSMEKFQYSAEMYWKGLNNQIEYRSAADLRGNENLEAELLFGKGRAYGLELLARKPAGRLNGWIAYTLSKTERKFNTINAGEWFNARQDRTHDVSLVSIFQMSERLSLSATFVYSTGNAVTFPTGKYRVANETVYLYGPRNSDRMPDYHRLDLSATLDGRSVRKFASSWTFGIYNAYGRKNAYLINFEDDKQQPGRTQAIQTSLFGLIPSITWNFKF